jgi:membrane protease YdiL (CAAX protease family)
LKRALKQALLVILVVLPVAWLLQGMSVLILTWLGHPPDEQAAVKLLEAAQPWWTRAYLAVFAIVLAPLAEEFIFRGLLYPFVKQLGWPRLALFGVSGLFALIHFDVATFLPLFVLALALTWLYEKTDNLLAPITVHALFNSANLVVLAAQQWSDAHGKA